MSDLSDFTKLVLARLETNPDEFQLGGRWDTLVRGIEAYVRGDEEDRYYRTLWPLDDPERGVIIAAYRKAYLARLHKDMLKNIVSGNDLGPSPEQTFQAGLGKQASQGTLRGASPSTLITDDIYDANRYTTGVTDTRGIFTAVAKAEGTPVNRYSLNSTQLTVAKKLGIDPGEYAKRIGATEL